MFSVSRKVVVFRNGSEFVNDPLSDDSDDMIRQNWQTLVPSKHSRPLEISPVNLLQRV